MKTLKITSTVLLILSCLLSFSQVKVLSTGKVAIGGGTINNAARLNISDTNNSTIYSKALMTFGWGDAVKSEVNRTDAIALSAWYNDNRNFMVFGNGDIWSATQITFSDSILKTNINPIDNPLSKIQKLRGITYNKKNDTEDKRKDHIGLLAQEVEKILPDLVYEDEHGTKAIAYVEIIPLLIESIKEQQKLINDLQTELNYIENDCCSKNDNLKNASIKTTQIENAVLYQNTPNPFSQTTYIKCLIPQATTNSMIGVYNMQGTLLKEITITQKGEVTIEIGKANLAPGMYLYSLLIDNRVIDTKRMVLTN